MFGKVIDLFTWSKKKVTKDPAPPETAGPSATTQMHQDAKTPQKLSEMSTADFEDLLLRMNAAREAAVAREHIAQAGIVRSRRFRKIALVVAIAAFVSWLFFPSGKKERLRIDATTFSASFLVPGALPGVSRTGHIGVIKVSGPISGTLHGAPLVSNTPL